LETTAGSAVREAVDADAFGPLHHRRAGPQGGRDVPAWDSPAEREAIKRRIVGSFNALPTLVGVLLRADKEGALWHALYNEGITDAYDDALSEAVKALGDEGIATVAHRYELDPEAVRSKVEGAEHVNSSAPHPSPGIEPSNP
jgi:hypothetical protein